MNDIVKYNNNLNEVRMKNLTAAEIDVFMTLCAKVKECECQEVTLDLREIKQISHYQKNGLENFRRFIVDLNRKIQYLNFEINTESKTIQFVLFPYFETDIEKMTLTVAVNPKFAFLLNDFANGNWTRFYLKEITTLKSKYAKNLYRNLKQYKKCGWWKVSVEELCNRLDIPDSCNTRNILSKYITPAVNELIENSYYQNITCEPIKNNDRTHKTVGYRFEFTPIDTLQN